MQQFSLRPAALTRRTLLGSTAATSLLATGAMTFTSDVFAKSIGLALGKTHEPAPRVSMGPALSFPAPSDVGLYFPSLQL